MSSLTISGANLMLICMIELELIYSKCDVNISGLINNDADYSRPKLFSYRSSDLYNWFRWKYWTLLSSCWVVIVLEASNKLSNVLHCMPWREKECLEVCCSQSVCFWCCSNKLWFFCGAQKAEWQLWSTFIVIVWKICHKRKCDCH